MYEILIFKNGYYQHITKEEVIRILKNETVPWIPMGEKRLCNIQVLHNLEQYFFSIENTSVVVTYDCDVFNLIMHYFIHLKPCISLIAYRKGKKLLDDTVWKNR